MANIAAQFQVPILPLYIENSSHLSTCVLFRRRLKVCMGKAIAYAEYKNLFDDKKEYVQFAQMVRSRIQQIKDQVQFS